MNDLDTLRPEVREALDEVTRCTECMHIADYSDAPDIIRAELLRLAGERDELRTAYTSASQSRDYWKECAGRASSDLAALKARMKPCARVVGGEVRVFMNSGDEGKYVAVLVVEE